MVDFYAVLEVDHDASQEDIKRSYHRLALRYHPDKAGPEGAAKFKEVNTAYEVLSDPQKKSIYDAYGEAGLDAMDNPVAGGAVAALGPTVSILITLVLLFITVAMILIFLAFLVSFVDGHLRSWNYVKVFSPLFVVDVVVGVPVFLLFFMTVIMMPKHTPMHCVFMAILCAIILTIVIPIAKDRNESRARQGRTDYLQWRVWLIPGYLFSVFVFSAVFFSALPTQNRILKLKSIGLVRLANYLPIGFIFSILEAACVVVFFALVACRADETITTNYFVVIGVPIFVGLTLFLINRLVFNILELYISDVPPEVRAAAQAAEEAAHGGEPSPSGAAEPEAHNPSNPMRGSGEYQGGLRADGAGEEQQHYSTESTGRSRHGANGADEEQSERQNNNDGEGGAATHPHGASDGRNPYAGQQGSCGGITQNMVTSCLIVGLLMASTAMIAVRLNYYYNYGTYAGVLTLAKACIPLFIIVGAILVVLMVGSFLVCCGVASVVVGGDAPHEHHNAEAGNQQEAGEEMQANNGNGNNTNNAGAANGGTSAAAAASGEETPGVPHQDAGTTGRPADKRRLSHEVGATPPERQPDNQHLSDID
ncbi:dnaj chaperone-like protein [Leptomonas pyrrhocoris]|uniref:Dnaj chaperone-like protein n=1 Tax=Leptomonas pyrrhocoris TaxID=157538 RepID=A0A0N0DSZ7_LEPPY|nr:dnaj chaperone-like protein [Leptomonas pyrrhocoris]KPA76684.1 dnaj chaperone-like protein [Leptomonas pyrrhocoris]|eukprot:XP_015655123.1 dnaj chaperone-like protein [Leptomonas pyrrhocoris]